jgi:hypothetical protein
MNPDDRKVVIVPCSGIGKPQGTVSREAAYELTEELLPRAERALRAVAARPRG